MKKKADNGDSKFNGFVTALKKQSRPAITVFILLVVLTGIAYPLAVTAIAQVAFEDEADGSLIYDEDGNVIGSVLIGQYIDEDEYPELFWPRLSAVNYDASSSGGSNLGPTSEELAKLVQDRVDLLKKYDPENTSEIPSDLVTASASGLDPDISYASAVYQIHRVMTYQDEKNHNTLTEEEIMALINAATTQDVLGNKYVNVLELNLSLSDIYVAESDVPDIDDASNDTILGLTVPDWTLIVIVIVALAFLTFIMAKLIFAIYEETGKIGKKFRNFIDLILRPVKTAEEMSWKTYLLSVILFNLLGFATLFMVLLFQDHLPLNPNGYPGLDPYLAFNTAVSFITNTDWQSYSGETTMSLFSQMFGLTVQCFLSAATGIAVLFAIIRGLRNRSIKNLGNFWIDVTKATFILLPLAIVVSIILISQGVPQTLEASIQATLAYPYTDSVGNYVTTQTIAMGPVASQEAIKLIGTNGGGFFNVNSAHPFENPTAITNIVEIVSILLIPISLCIVFGKMIKDRRQSTVIISVMLILFISLFIICLYAELGGNPAVDSITGVSQTCTQYQFGGNLEGKEVRFNVVGSVLFDISATATSCGAVNSMLDSYTAIGGMCPMILIQLGEICFGGVGCGLYGMFMFVILAVFIAGLMIGRIPEYLGKKIGPNEMRLASIAVVLPVVLIVGGTAIAILWPGATDSVHNTGMHGFSEILYAFSSASGNNGSAFAGLNANTPFYNVALAVCMIIGRFGTIILVLAFAGSMSEKKVVTENTGNLSTGTPMFATWLLIVILLIGVLGFFLCFSLGPIAETLTGL